VRQSEFLPIESPGNLFDGNAKKAIDDHADNAMVLGLVTPDNRGEVMFMNPSSPGYNNADKDHHSWNLPFQGESEINRRDFLRLSAAAAVVAATEGVAWAANSRDLPRRKLGRTGETVSMIGLGGFHLGLPSEEASIRIVRTAIDSGMNFLDNCWDYNDGASEIRMGKALRDGYRDRAFLMTKIDGRDKLTAQKQIDESLRRLQTDHLDLLQLHEVIRLNDPERAFAGCGAIEALQAAKKTGKARFLGFTGHKDPHIHLKMLETAGAHGFRFDTVQMPLNVMDAHFNSFEKKVLPLLVTMEIGVLGMKPMGSGVILESKTVSAVECLHYAMNLPTSVVITGCDSLPILQQALDAARSFRPMNGDEVSALLARTAPASNIGQFELYKTSPRFDSTQQHLEWLG
jgi:diketogulonate reductase-like aldo/keto reductase